MKRLYILLFISAFAFSGVSYAQKAERKNIREGNKLYGTEKYTESEIAYRKGLDVNPRSIEGTYNLGNALYKQQKFDEAAQQYQQIAGIGESVMKTKNGTARLAQTYHNLGNIFMQKKDYGQSVEAYKQSLRINPYDDATRYNLALAQKLLKDQQQQQQQNQDQQDKDKKDEEKQEQDTQEQPQQNEQMSKDNAQQMLDAFLQDEKNTQEKVRKAQMQQQQRKKTDKEW